MWARAKGVEMLTVSVRDVSRREGRKVREAAQQGISVGSLEWLTCSRLGVGSRGGRRLARENEYKLAAACGSRDSGREAEQGWFPAPQPSPVDSGRQAYQGGPRHLG